MLSFYQSLSMVVVTSLGLGAILARLFGGDISIGAYELVMFIVFAAASVYLTISAYKTKGGSDVR